MLNTEENRNRIFFSYSRKDEAFALRLAHALRENGVSIWIDKLDLSPGANWDQEVEEALRVTRRTLVILSPDSVLSDHVRDEIGLALDERDLVVPVLYRDCQIPMRLRRRQWVDFRGDFASAVRELLTVLRDQPNQTAVGVGDLGVQSNGQQLGAQHALAPHYEANLRSAQGSSKSRRWLAFGMAASAAILVVRQSVKHSPGPAASASSVTAAFSAKPAKVAEAIRLGKVKCAFIEGNNETYWRDCVVTTNDNGTLHIVAPGTALNPGQNFELTATQKPDGSYATEGRISTFQYSGTFSGKTKVSVDSAGVRWLAAKDVRCCSIWLEPEER